MAPGSGPTPVGIGKAAKLGLGPATTTALGSTIPIGAGAGCPMSCGHLPGSSGAAAMTTSAGSPADRLDSFSSPAFSFSWNHGISATVSGPPP